MVEPDPHNTNADPRHGSLYSTELRREMLHVKIPLER